MSYTATSTYTMTHTATHLADVILGSIADILASLRLDPTQIFGNWETYQQAISNWIDERSLTCVSLECHRPGGAVSPIIEFPVGYTGTGEGDRRFTADRASLARYLAKLQTVPPRTTYSLVCSFNEPPSDQPGWGSGQRASTAGMSSNSFGTLAAGPHASAGLRYFRR